MNNSPFPQLQLNFSPLAMEIKNLHDQILLPNLAIHLQMKTAIALEMSARQEFVAPISNHLSTILPIPISFNWGNERTSQFSPRNVKNVPTKNVGKIFENEEKNEIEILEYKKGKNSNKIMNTNELMIYDNDLEEFSEIFNSEYDDEIKLSKWRQKYLASMSNVFSQCRNQPRQMLSRRKYEILVDRVKKIELMEAAGAQLPLHILKIRKKYRVINIPSKNGPKTMLAERKGNRIFICVDQLFDVLYKYHMDTRHGRSISMYTQTRKKFANITVECILKFLGGCEDCKKWNKNEKKLNTLLTPNRNKEKKIRYGNFFDFNNQIISCRNCPYKREEKADQKSTNALRSHLKKYHQELLRESRQKEIKQENNEFGMEEGMKGTKKYLLCQLRE